jgi:hypothetical protein
MKKIKKKKQMYTNFTTIYYQIYGNTKIIMLEVMILQLSLKYCHLVRDKGVKCVLRNCKQLREIDLKHCPRVLHVNVASMLLLRPSLTKIKLPSGVAWVAPLVSTKT